MKTKTSGLIFGLGSILFGIYLLLEKFFYFYIEDYYVGAILFGIVAFAFYVQFAADRKKWWALILGSVTLFLAYVFFATTTYWVEEDSIGVAVLAIAGLTFLVAYFNSQDNWGLLIPAGACLTISLVVLSQVTYFIAEDTVPFILFGGMAITFGILYFMSNEQRKLKWAAYPASILAVLSFIVLLVEGRYYVEDYVAPSLFILFGIIVIIKNLTAKRKSDDDKLQVQDDSLQVQ